MIDYKLFLQIKKQLEVNAQYRGFKSQSYTCTAYDRPSSNSKLAGTVKIIRN